MTIKQRKNQLIKKATIAILTLIVLGSLADINRLERIEREKDIERAQQTKEESLDIDIVPSPKREVKKEINKSNNINQIKQPTNTNRLTKSRGVCNYNGFIEKWYSQRVLRGGGLKIPGRHVTPDGLVRDKDGFIVVATKHFNKGTVLNISLGKAKVYDKCPIDRVIDVYTNW